MNKIIPVIAALTILAITAAKGAPAPSPDAIGNLKTAVFAGGCFWCIQPAFDKAPGVVKTIVGYCGGNEPDPTYELVTSERTKYRESLQVTYDPAKISFAQL